MGKFIVVIPCVLILVACLNLSAVADHGFPQAMEECKLQEKATDEDFKSMRNPSQPKTPAMKCVFTCLGEKSGKIVNNKLSPDGYLNWVKDAPNYNEQMQQSANEIVEECKNVGDPIRCEAGAKIMDCLMQAAQKRGIKPHFHGKSKM